MCQSFPSFFPSHSCTPPVWIVFVSEWFKCKTSIIINHIIIEWKSHKFRMNVLNDGIYRFRPTTKKKKRERTTARNRQNKWKSTRLNRQIKIVEVITNKTSLWIKLVSFHWSKLADLKWLNEAFGSVRFRLCVCVCLCIIYCERCLRRTRDFYPFPTKIVYIRSFVLNSSYHFGFISLNKI